MRHTEVFAGPSVTPATVVDELPGAIVRPPAAFGDIHAAHLRGASTVVLIDGYFEHVRSVWHKEILHALDAGMRVIGAASMGALRAAELSTFGMEGVGRIFEKFHTGEWTDDDEVAVAHMDADAEYKPISDAMANIRLTLEDAVTTGEVSEELALAVVAAGKSDFYPDRTWARCVARAIDSQPALADAGRDLVEWAARRAIDHKHADAVEALREARSGRRDRPMRTWRLELTSHWDEALEELSATPSQPDGDATGRVTLDDILDELALDPVAHSKVRLEALGRFLSGLWADAAGISLGPAQTQQALDKLLFTHGFGSREEVDAWRRHEGLDDPGFQHMVTTEALHDWATGRARGPLSMVMGTTLKAQGRYGDLRARAAARKDVVSQRGWTDAAAAESVDDSDVLAWWFQSLGTTTPDDVDAFLVEHGYEDKPRLLRALRRAMASEQAEARP